MHYELGLILRQFFFGDTMYNALTTTLFIGIDVSSETNYIFALYFFGKKLLSFQAKNNLLAPKKLSLISYVSKRK